MLILLMGFLILAILVGVLASLGYGLLLEKRLFVVSQVGVEALSPGVLLILGMSAIGFLSLGINFFFPLSELASVSICLLGWLLLARNYHSLKKRVTREAVWMSCFLILSLGLIAVSSFYNIDTGFYHLPSIALSRTYPVIPGIANLFGPYGHSSTWFLLEAVFSLPGLGYAGTFSLNSILGLAFLLFLVEEKRNSSVRGVVFVFLSLICLNQGFLALGGLTPDFPGIVMGSIIWLWLLDENSLSRKEVERRAALGFLLTVFAVTIKLSNVLIGVPCGVLLFKALKRKGALGQGQMSFNNRQLISCCVLGSLFLLLWIIRNVMTSGCLVYPQPFTCFNSLPWAMPKQSVGAWLMDVKYHLCGVRSEGSVFSDLSCLSEWKIRFLKEPLLKYLFCLVGMSGLWRLTFLFRAKTGEKKTSEPSMISLWVVLGGCAGLWLLTAPNLRFASWIFLAMAGLAIATLIEPVEISSKQRNSLFYLFLTLGIVGTLRSALVTNPHGMKWKNWPMVPSPTSHTVEQSAQIQINMPANGFQCWDVSPICTPEKVSVLIKEKFGRAVIIPKAR